MKNMIETELQALENTPVHIGNIKKTSIENGDGVRVSVFISGCPHHCKGCHNPEAWAYDFGETLTNDMINEIAEACEPEYISGITLLGGEPLAPHNQLAALEILRRFKIVNPDKTIWIYSGYTLNELKDMKSSVVNEILQMTDVLVDGRFEEDKKVVDLRFRGSTNQNIINLKK